MNLIKDHLEYLKDNPEGYWFKRKLYGYGWTPAKPAGWATIGVYVAFLVGIIRYAQLSGNYDNGQPPVGIIALIVLVTILLFAVVWRTGEPLKWQWGQKHDKK